MKASRTQWMWTRASLALVSAAAVLLATGCGQPQSAARPVISEKLYVVTPDHMTVKAGIVTGEVLDMKVVERVEDGSGRIDVPAKLSGKLVVKNVSTDQAVRLVGGKIGYFDMQGKPIALEDNRAAPLLKLAASYGSGDRLDPGQDATHTFEVEFPAEALKAKRLKDIRLGLSYIPTAYKEEMLNFPVSIGSKDAK